MLKFNKEKKKKVKKRGEREREKEKTFVSFPFTSIPRSASLAYFCSKFNYPPSTKGRGSANDRLGGLCNFQRQITEFLRARTRDGETRVAIERHFVSFSTPLLSFRLATFVYRGPLPRQYLCHVLNAILLLLPSLLPTTSRHAFVERVALSATRDKFSFHFSCDIWNCFR